jgi:hypothetical protein
LEAEIGGERGNPETVSAVALLLQSPFSPFINTQITEIIRIKKGKERAYFALFLRTTATAATAMMITAAATAM